MKLRAGFLDAQQSVTDLCPGEVGHNPETHTLFNTRFNIRYILPHRCLGLPRDIFISIFPTKCLDTVA